MIVHSELFLERSVEISEGINVFMLFTMLLLHIIKNISTKLEPHLALTNEIEPLFDSLIEQQRPAMKEWSRIIIMKRACHRQ